MVAIEALIQNEYFQFLLIFAGSIIFAKILHFFLKNYVHKLTEKTKTDIDEIILEIVTKPLYAFIIVLGMYFALKSLSILDIYTLLIGKIFFVVIVLLASLTASRVFSVLISRWLKVQKRFEKTPRLINRIISVVIYLIAILIILNHFQVEVTPLVATLGLGGLAVGLALQNTLSNFFAGLHIISDRPINVGDFIELEGNISGYVEDIGWRSTRIRTLPNTIVIVPNSKLAESTITNNSLPEPEMSVMVQCGVSYGSDLKKVEKVTIDVAGKIQKTVPGAVKTFEPFIRYHTFGDSNINFTVILRVEKFVDRYLVIHEFIKALKESYDKEKIEISWPVRKVYQAK
ncbi:mechanosensitive ion channel [Candidatus Woesearchaeota archaeon]|nr:mechanosensitive ion channel [Candidatus Woesearchaeota archaeon]